MRVEHRVEMAALPGSLQQDYGGAPSKEGYYRACVVPIIIVKEIMPNWRSCLPEWGLLRGVTRGGASESRA
jgi:hypothetical protein